MSSKPTLLRKLLAPQLHRESSIALQAVRFVVRSNFFLSETEGEGEGESEGAAANGTGGEAPAALQSTPATPASVSPTTPASAAAVTAEVAASEKKFGSGLSTAVLSPAGSPPAAEEDEGGAASPAAVPEKSSAER